MAVKAIGRTVTKTKTPTSAVVLSGPKTGTKTNAKTVALSGAKTGTPVRATSTVTTKKPYVAPKPVVRAAPTAVKTPAVVAAPVKVAAATASPVRATAATAAPVNRVPTSVRPVGTPANSLRKSILTAASRIPTTAASTLSSGTPGKIPGFNTAGPGGVYSAERLPDGVTSRIDPGNTVMANKVSQAVKVAQMAQSISRAAALAQAVRGARESMLPTAKAALLAGAAPRTPLIPPRPASEMATKSAYVAPGSNSASNVGTISGGSSGGSGAVVSKPATTPRPTPVPTTPTTTPRPTTPAVAAVKSQVLRGHGTAGQDQRRRLGRGPISSLSLTPEMLRAMAARRFGGT
jgi:ribonuclease E